ncbi:hypothetical protein WA026_006512 [Henosepilachna vigintioctopunctata]|uniref:Uncharacterized protein n=1 Tax=Henosepilachna vigintioctopunctata TaxID=420089 RepID=A0AAW1UFX2_9CUCU
MQSIIYNSVLAAISPDEKLALRTIKEKISEIVSAWIRPNRLEEESWRIWNLRCFSNCIGTTIDGKLDRITDPSHSGS